MMNSKHLDWKLITATYQPRDFWQVTQPLGASVSYLREGDKGPQKRCEG